MFRTTLFIFLFVGCARSTEPASSPVEMNDTQFASRVRPVGPPQRFAKPDGTLLNVAADGTRIEGTLIARCVINEEGDVEQCKFVKNPFATPNEEFAAILQAQKFEPVIFEGKPQRVNYTFRINFKGADEYINDLIRICRVHEITGKPPELGLKAVSQWLTDNIKTEKARKRLSELPEADLPVWLQTLRQDAAKEGISPCPFADHWEDFLKRPQTNSESP